MRGRRAEASTSTSMSSCDPSADTDRKYSTKKNDNIKMEMYNQFYENFERPPTAPVYYPTIEEFTDPIEYVAKIRAEAEPYGVIKIVPPSSFKPPFAIDRSTFTFRPRTQKLNEVEAIIKEKHTFVERLINYNRMSGLPYELPHYNNNFIDLHRLHRIVQTLGGCQIVNEKNIWKQVAIEMLPSNKVVKNISQSFIKLLKTHYNTYVEPFVRNLKERSELDDDESDDEMEELKHKYQHHHGTMRNDTQQGESDDETENDDDCPVSMQSGRRRSKQKKTPSPKQSRMMAGGIKKPSPPKRKKVQEEENDPMDTVFCITCNGGENEELLLLCDIEGCNNGRHTYCCDPPLDEVPTGEWRCPKCIAAEDAKIGLDWGFYDADTEYNLNSFAEYANRFKCDYFEVTDPMAVPCEDVEKEFWKNVISSQESVAVKYGADLITSKVGSGFPRKEDKCSGHDAKVRHQYANHAWNLNNLPVLRESVLSHIDFGISGMMVPWVYVGMCFSTFCWHTEDHWTYSINYNHWGERKIWYGIGGDDAEKFEEAVRKLAPGLTGRQRDLFHHMTTAANPALLRSLGVPIHTVHQNPGEFVITFPRAYHAGFNEGLNFAEAVNFAPVDWLYKGRLCMEEYSMVRRYCVFSHDELVFKMVEARDKLGISMSVATLDELMEISKREQTSRLLASQLGIENQEIVIFEDLQDDQRTCRFCRTTLFLSALSCEHNKIVCLSHYDHLCKKCPIETCTLQVRYELDDFLPFIDQLENRTKEYYGWKSSTDMLLHDGDKPLPSKIEELVDYAKQHRYPTTSHMQNLLSIRQKTRNAIDKANSLLNGKVRTRVRTRIQRADTRLDVEGIRLFIEELKTMTCDMNNFVDKLEMLNVKVNEWRSRANRAIGIKKEVKKEVEDETMGVKKEVVEKEEDEKKMEQEEMEQPTRELTETDIRDMIREGEEFDIKLEEIEQLNKVIEQKQWEEKANELLKWRSYDRMELEDDYEYKKRWTTDEVMTLIKTGHRLARDSHKEKMLRLQNMVKQGKMHDGYAEAFMKNPDLDKMVELWRSIRESDWFSDKNINILRTEVYRVNSIVQYIDKLVGYEEKISLSHKFERINSVDIKLADIVEICALCEDSEIVTKTGRNEQFVELKERIEQFTEKIGKLFKQIPSYHSLYEIISEREDLSALAEGQHIRRYLQSVSIAPCDEWNKMSDFESIEQMINHQTSLRSSQRKIIGNLQAVNSSRGLESCRCLGTLKAETEKQQQTICCILCRANYHVTCCDWSPALQNLPTGAYVCVLCLKGKRPALEDVQVVCNTAPQNCYEVKLVSLLLDKAREISKELMSMENLEDLSKCRNVLNEFLSCEVVNIDVWPKAIEQIQVVFGDVIEAQKIQFESLKQKPNSKVPAEIIFIAKTVGGSGRKGKRISNVKEPIGRKLKRRSHGINPTIYEKDEEQVCSVEECFRPYGDQVNWIMCEAGCERWFHYVCVGLTIDDITKMPNYSCHRCVISNGSTGSPSSGSASSD